MVTLVTVLHVIICLFLVLVILLQAGKGAGMGILGGASQTMFGGRGATTFLGKMTGSMAFMFMVTSMFLAYSAWIPAPTMHRLPTGEYTEPGLFT